MDNLICPECNGSKGSQENNTIERIQDGEPMILSFFVPCYYCAGTGYQTDDDPIERFTHEI